MVSGQLCVLLLDLLPLYFLLAVLRGPCPGMRCMRTKKLYASGARNWRLQEVADDDDALPCSGRRASSRLDAAPLSLTYCCSLVSPLSPHSDGRPAPVGSAPERKKEREAESSAINYAKVTQNDLYQFTLLCPACAGSMASDVWVRRLSARPVSAHNQIPASGFDPSHDRRLEVV
uniref:Uncharacterized protein n=1 Tax=Anopheles coluzzii TaxID=1518534 RepID=A0A8W7PW21_ANOCL